MNDFSKNYEDLTFTDNFMFGKIMQNPKICIGVIERLLHIKVAKIEYQEIEKSFSPILGQHGVRFDVYLEDSNTVYDIEMQNYSIDDIGKRCRYYQSSIDVNSLSRGTDYNDLKESYILFLCGFDPFKEGLPSYSFTHRAKEDPQIELGDKCTCIVYNYRQSAQENDPEIREFLNFLATNEAENDFTQEIKELVMNGITEGTYFREYMACRLHDRDVKKSAREEGLQQGLQQGIQQGKLEGEKAGKLDAARKMLSKGCDTAFISDITGLSFETIQSLQI